MFNFINRSAYHENQRQLKMELAKITAFVTGFINVFLYVGAWFANLDSIKSTILFIVALGMSLYRFWRWRKSSIQNELLKNEAIRKDRIMNEREEIENEIRRHKLSKEIKA